MSKIIFVTGTDTGVGKTLLSALLLFHLRQKGVHALAMKPFCSGGRADVRRLQALQKGELSDDEVNPFYYRLPLAPMVAAGKKSNQTTLSDAVSRINKIAQRCERLVVEGSGGVLVPLGAKFMVADLIAALNCQVIITSLNRLGTINHTLLTVHALRAAGIMEVDMLVALMSIKNPDVSAKTNLKTLAQLLDPMKIAGIPFLGGNAGSRDNICRNYPGIRAVLAGLT